MSVQGSDATQTDAPRSYRRRLRGKVSEHLASLTGKPKGTTDLTTASTTDFELVSADKMSDDDDEDDEEDQSDADTDETWRDAELDMWAEAEMRLRKDGKKQHILEEYDRILEAHVGTKIEPIGTQTRREQFATILAAEVEKLQRTQRADGTRWGKCKRKAKRSFETAAKAVVASKDIISPATSACLPAGVACTGIVIILSLCLSAIEQRQVLFESLDYVSGAIRRIAEYEALCRNTARARNEETEDALTDACCNILTFQAHVLCFLQRNPVASAIRNMFERDGWKTLLSGMADAEKRVKACAEREQMNRVVDIYGKVNDLGEIANELLQQTRAQEAETRRDEAHAFLQLLFSNTCIYKESKQRNRERVLGTCDWFTGHDLFTKWDIGTDPDTPSLLYVTADPGCGKSVLSRYLVDKILPDDKRTVCYFFFRDDFEQQRTAKSALCALLHQIFSNNRHLLTANVLDQYGAQGKELVESFDDLWKIFVDAASHQETVCVLDALDECRESDMKQLIEAVVRTDIPGLRFLLTSRPYAHIRRAFSAKLLSRIHLKGDHEDTANKIAEEIKLVVDNRVNTTADAFALTPEERQLMRDQLASVPNRTYLWISLVFDGLMGENDITKEDIFNLTKKLPHGVYAAYEKILQKSRDKAQTRRLLHLILGAERPLTLSEVAVALVLDGSQHWRDVKERIVPETRVRDTIRNLCGLFVTVVDDRVYLLHQTAREFLLYGEPKGAPENEESNKRHEGVQRILFLLLTLIVGFVQPLFHNLWLFISNSWQASIRLSESNELLAETCIARLRPTLGVEPDASLFEYSTEYWPTHYVRSGAHFRTRMGKATQELCSQPQLGEILWHSYMRNKDSRSKRIQHPENPLCLASMLGIDGAVKEYLRQSLPAHERKAMVNFPDTKLCWSPLFWAAENGHETVVKLLLASGQAEINQRDFKGNTPLTIAAVEGHTAVVQQLIAAFPAGVNLKSDNDLTPLTGAVYRDRKAIVHLFLATGQADLDLKDDLGDTPLTLAVEVGHEGIVQLLITEGRAEVNSKNDSGQTLLSIAACKGHEAIVRLLLATGRAEIDSKDDQGQTPLSWAVMGGHEAIVQLLITTGGAEVDLKDNEGLTPLILAAKSGNEAAVDLLLATGRVEIESKDENGWTAFSWAVQFGSVAIMTRLLNRQAKVDSKDNDGRTPLSLAAPSRSEDFITLLLDRQADIDSKDNRGWTPLLWAVRFCNVAVITLLLDRQAEVDSKDNDGQTPLSWAALSGNEGVATLLLDRQAEVDSKDNDGRTPLSWAADRGHEDVVKRLLATGKAGVHVKDSSGRTPLLWAAMSGNTAVVQLLLDAGQADIDSQYDPADLELIRAAAIDQGS